MNPPTHKNLDRILILVVVVIMVAWIAIADVATGGTWGDWLAPTPVLSLVGLVVGFLMLSYQLETQHSNTLEHHRRQAEGQLRLQLYDKIASRIEGTRNPLAKLSVAPRSCMIQLRNNARMYTVSTYVPATEYQPEYFCSLYDQASSTVIDLGSALHFYEIALPRFDEFMRQIFRQEGLVRDSVYAFSRGVTPFVKLGGYGPVQWPPTETQLEELDYLARKVLDVAVELSATTEDLRVEAQNHLLGGLFPDRRAKYREPQDPSLKVLRLDPKSE